jgi:hypothetical protein
MKNFISTNRPVYLIKFLNSNELFIFGSTAETLGDLIQKKGNNGIDFLKQFDSSKQTFKKMSKEDIKSWFAYDTHSIEELKRINYIK